MEQAGPSQIAPPYRLPAQLYQQAHSFAIPNKVSHGPILITAFSTIEFSLRGQLGGFYEEGDVKEA